jgi:hypothetical protein
MFIENRGFKINVDVAETKNYYDSATQLCDCSYCNNYLKAIISQHKELIKFFERMGIDYKKEGEAMHFNENDNGTHYYISFYHVVGEIINGENINHKFNEDITITVSNTCDLLPTDFPRPCFQINITANLNWVI